MGLLDSIIFGTALGVSGAFDKNRKTDKAAAFGVALGASIGSGRKWAMADSIRLGASINALDSMKEDISSSYSYSGSSYDTEDYGSIGYCGSDYGSSNHEYDDLILICIKFDYKDLRLVEEVGCQPLGPM